MPLGHEFRLRQLSGGSNRFPELSDAEKAEERFYNILSSSPNFRKTGGDALANCVLDKDDGMMSEIGEYTHFSLFEYASCNLNSKIHIIKDL